MSKEQTVETPHGGQSSGVSGCGNTNNVQDYYTALSTEVDAVLNHPFQFSVIKNSRDTNPVKVEKTWGEFLTGWLAEPEENPTMSLEEYLAADHDTRAKVKNGRAWIPAVFIKEGKRVDTDVLAMTAAVLDFDDGAIGFADVESRLDGWTFAAHTSFSHTSQKPKLRVILPFSKPAEPALCLPIFEHFNTLFGGHCDPARKNPSGLYYLPACPYDASDQYRHISQIGALFDPAIVRKNGAGTNPANTREPVQKVPAGENPILEGGRNQHLTSLAGSMRRRGMAETAILAALFEENQIRCNPPLPDKELKTIARSVGRYTPAVSDYPMPLPPDFFSWGDRGSPDRQETPTEWPDPIIPGMATVPDIPADLLPRWVGDMAGAVAKNTKTPPAMAVMLALSVLATVLQRRFEVAPKGIEEGYTEPLALWVLTAMPPGANKTAVLNALKRPLDRWEKLTRDRMRRDVARVFSEREVATKRIESLKIQAAKAKTADEREKLRAEIQQEMEDMPAELIPPQLITTSITAEKLEQLLVDHHERMAILSDEGGIFQTMSGQYTGGVANIDVYLKSHSGSSLHVNRAKRNAHLERPALSFGLAIQPGIMAESAKTKRFVDSGLLARFLYAIPKSNVGKRDVRERYAIPGAVTAAWEGNIQSLLDSMDLPIGAPRVIPFDDDAMEHWLEFSQKVENQQGDGAKYEHLTEWTSKLPGAVARMAGLLHLAIHGVHATNISLDSVERAVMLGRLLTKHADAAFARMGATKVEGDALHVYRWIKARDLAEFTRREIQTALRGRFGTVEPLLAALKQLAEQYVISPEIKTRTGGRPSAYYQVNPKLLA